MPVGDVRRDARLSEHGRSRGQADAPVDAAAAGARATEPLCQRPHRIPTNPRLPPLSPSSRQRRRRSPSASPASCKVARGAAEQAAAGYVSVGVPAQLAEDVGSLWTMRCVFDLSDLAITCDCSVEELAEVYFTLSAHLELDWLRARIEELPVDDRWKNFGRLALSDDLFSLQAAFTADAGANAA